MIIVEGRVRFDDERGEITISPTTSFKAPKWDSLKTFTLSAFREYAGIKTDTPEEEQDTRYFIDIPPYWTKDDLLDLKDFLSTLEVGLVPVWIRVQWLEKNTKFTISEVAQLEAWVKKRK
jgi:hypothetical protein